MIGVLPIGRAEPGGEKMAAFFWSLKPADAEAVQARGLQAWKERVLALWPACAPYLAQIDSFDQLTLARRDPAGPGAGDRRHARRGAVLRPLLPARVGGGAAPDASLR